MKVLVVQHDFTCAPQGGKDAPAPEPKSYRRGDIISDPAAIKDVRDQGQAHFCTPSDVADDFFKPDPPPADPAPAKAKA